MADRNGASMSWSDAWERGETPWDAGAPCPELERLVEEGALPEGRALVPGCGSGYDVFALAGEDCRAVGLDVAPGAAERFESLRAELGVPAEWVEFVVEDFFDYQPESLFDVVWDYTFLCALEPDRREPWARRMRELIRPGGVLATLIFPVADPEAQVVEESGSGPPYRMSPDLVESLVSGGFAKRQLRPARESHPGREGKEWVGLWERRP